MLSINLSICLIDYKTENHLADEENCGLVLGARDSFGSPVTTLAESLALLSGEGCTGGDCNGTEVGESESSLG